MQGAAKLIVGLAEKGLRPQGTDDRLNLEEKELSATFWAVCVAWRTWKKTRSVRVEPVTIAVEMAPGEVARGRLRLRR